MLSKSISSTLLLYLLSGCGGTQQELPSVESTPIASKAEMDNLQKRRSEDKKVLEEERAKTDKRVEELKAQIDELNKSLGSSQEMNLQEREKIQKQLEEARREKQAAEDRLKQLQENQKRLDDQLAAAKTTTPSQQTSTPATTGGSSSQSGGIVTTTSGTGSTTSSTSSPSSGTTTPSMNPSGSPQIGTAFSCATNVTSSDGGSRLQATFNGGTVAYVVHWIDMSGKLMQITSISGGASQVVNTTLGHAFELRSPDGVSCYGRVKVGSSQNIFTVR